RNGPFQRPEDIVKVKGIGPQTYQRLKELITVQ
ncbi:MAG: helix-hairpin-helix domain-containing protein, partial [Chloroflexota bacterium]